MICPFCKNSDDSLLELVIPARPKSQIEIWGCIVCSKMFPITLDNEEDTDEEPL